jgi:hypothetical protein
VPITPSHNCSFVYPTLTHHAGWYQGTKRKRIWFNLLWTIEWMQTDWEGLPIFRKKISLGATTQGLGTLSFVLR